MNPVFDIGIRRPSIVLPRSDIDLKKWAVIACDQFTSQPEYWQQVKEIVGDSPSTFHMILLKCSSVQRKKIFVSKQPRIR